MTALGSGGDTLVAAGVIKVRYLYILSEGRDRDTTHCRRKP